MIYIWDNGKQYSDHDIAFIETDLSLEEMEGIVGRLNSGIPKASFGQRQSCLFAVVPELQIIHRETCGTISPWEWLDKNWPYDDERADALWHALPQRLKEALPSVIRERLAVEEDWVQPEHRIQQSR